MVLKIVVLLSSAVSLILLLIANLGTTFKSTFLPNIYLVQLNEAVTGRYIRYGVFNSCMFFGDTFHSCTVPKPAYVFDGNQFAEFCGADMTNASMVEIYTDVISDAKLNTFQGIMLIMPAGILSFVAFVNSIALYKSHKNIVPFVGAFFSLTGFLAVAGSLALTIATFWRGMSYLERRVEGLSYQWGPAIYLVGIGSLGLLITLICFFTALFSPDNAHYNKRDTYRFYNYDLDSPINNHDSPTVPLTSNDSYGYSHTISTPRLDNYRYPNDVSSPTQQSYPSYHQNQGTRYNNKHHYDPQFY